ncbi:MAG: hypothetical protein E7Z96_00245 [Actinomycetaceae bacterium]|jgi:hypothetical protein|nr:hypothetical protein [Actinomycetaceae bacterium]
MEPNYYLRTTSQYVTAGILGAIAAILLVVQVIQTGLRDLFFTAVFAIGVLVIALVFYLMPNLEVNRDGIVIHNTFTRVFIPYGQLAATETRWGLRLTAANGKTYAVRSFSGSGSSRQYKATGEQIPVVHSGSMRMTVSTRAAYNLIDDMLAEFPPRRNPRARELRFTRQWSWESISLAAVAFACLILGVTLAVQ